jgi:hypothetical protein
VNFVAIYFAKDPVKERSWQKDLEVIRLRRERREARWALMLEDIDIDNDPYYREEPPEPKKEFVWRSKEAYEWHLWCQSMDAYQREYDAGGTY